MSIEETIRTRLDELVAEAETLRHRVILTSYSVDETVQECQGWLAAAVNIAEQMLPDSAGYRKRIERIAEKDYGHRINQAVGEVAALLVNLIKDSERGLLSSVADHARAEVFDDFLDHAKSYMQSGHKNEAGVIAGVVFEDTVRRLCRRHGIEENGKKLDELISQLAKSNVLSAIKAKLARVAAHVRTKATHAQWDEFKENDVEATVKFTEELILEHVDK